MRLFFVLSVVSFSVVTGCAFAKLGAKMPGWHMPVAKEGMSLRRLLQAEDAATCPDDPYGALSASGTSCADLIAQFSGDCSVDLNTLSPQAPVGSFLRVLCPKSCSWCYKADKALVIGDGQATKISRLLDYGGFAIDAFAETAKAVGRDMCYWSMQPLPAPPGGWNVQTRDCGNEAPCSWDTDSLTASDEAKKYFKDIADLGVQGVDRFNDLVTEDSPALGGWVAWGRNLQPTYCETGLLADQCGEQDKNHEDINWPTSSILLRINPDNTDKVKDLIRNWRRTEEGHLPQMKADAVHKWGYGSAGGEGLTFKLIPCDAIPDKFLRRQQTGSYTQKFTEAYTYWKDACNGFYDPSYSPNGDYSKCPVAAEQTVAAVAEKDTLGLSCSSSNDCSSNQKCQCDNAVGRRLMFGGAQAKATQCTCQHDCASDEAVECENSGCAICDSCVGSTAPECAICESCSKCSKYKTCKNGKEWCFDKDPVTCLTNCGNCDGTNCILPNEECKPCWPVVAACGPSCDNPIAQKLAAGCQSQCGVCISCIGQQTEECAPCAPCLPCMSFIKCFTGQFAGLTSKPADP